MGQTSKLSARIENGEANILGWRLPSQGLSNGKATAYVRPSDWSLSHHDAEGTIGVTVKDIRAVGPRWQLDLVHGNELLEIELSSRDELGDSDLVSGHKLWLRPIRAHLFAAT